MAKAVFGEYAAFTNKNSVRYQKNNKLVSAGALPSEVVAYLNKQLGYTPPTTGGGESISIPVETKFPMPSEEEKARLRAESLQVKPELQVEAPLTIEDFETEYEPMAETSKDHIIYGKEEYNHLAELSQEAPVDYVDQQAPATVDPDFLEQVSIHTASIKDIAEALLNRFGLYTVYLGRHPIADEINPLTGEMFTKYHLGIAYQAAIRAQHTGVANRPAEEARKQIEQNRAASENYLDAFTPAPQTMAEARRADSFEYRTSPQATRSVATTEVVHITDENGQVHAVQRDIPAGQTGEFNGAKARYDADEDDIIVEPNFGGKPIIRPNW